MKSKMLEPLTDVEVEEGLRICEAATEGPWQSVKYGIVHPDDDADDTIWVVRNGWNSWEEFLGVEGDDENFIIHVRTAFPRALHTIKALREENEELRHSVMVWDELDEMTGVRDADQ